MKDYNLGFISNEDIFDHVKTTVEKYRNFIDLKEFNRNLIDPIKLTFDSKVYGRNMKRIIEDECIRQIDKSNTNHIGYFHQNLFKYAGNGWEVPATGYDVQNKQRHIFVEMKNKHNTMNSTSATATYSRMQDTALNDPQATCMLVEAIATGSHDTVWICGNKSCDRIRRVSMDKFYGIVFGDEKAFFKLCVALPDILDDVVAVLHKGKIKNKVYKDLDKLSLDTFKSLYLLAFKTYDGFENFNQ